MSANSSTPETSKEPPLVSQKMLQEKSLLERHLLVHNKEKLHTCKICKKCFKTKGSLRLHMMIHSGEKPHTCETCKKCFKRTDSLKYHMMTHTGKKPHICKICAKNFIQKGDLKKHMMTHTGEKPHICEICEKRFIQQHILNRHMRMHTGEKPHICEYCKKNFSRPDHLNKHMRIHTGEKPHICEFCDKKFTQKGNLKRHMRVHTGEQPHICEICGKIFIQKENIKRHVVTQNRKKYCYSETCNKSFSKQEHLKTQSKSQSHLKKKHFANSKSNNKLTQEQNMNQHMSTHLKKDNIGNSMSGGNILETFEHGLIGQLTSNKNCNSDAQSSNITGQLQQNALFQDTDSSHSNSISPLSKHDSRNTILDESPLDLSKTGMKHSLSENKTNDSQLHKISTPLATASCGIDIKNQPYNFTSSTYIPPQLSRKSPIDGMKNVQMLENKPCQSKSNASTTRQQSKSISPSQLYSLPFRKRYLRQHTQHLNFMNVPETQLTYASPSFFSENSFTLSQSPSYNHSYSHENFQSQSELSSCNDTSKLDTRLSQLSLQDSGPMIDQQQSTSQQQRKVKPPTNRMPKRVPDSKFC